MTQVEQAAQQPFRQAVHPGLDGFHAHALQMLQTDFHGWNAEVVQRAVFETGFARRQHVQAPLQGGEVDGAAAEPRAAQRGQRCVAHQQATHAGGVAEHLVERQGHEIGPVHLQVQPVGGHESGGVHQHLPAVGLGLVDQRQRVLDA